jgi:hypothetical protein
MTLEHQQEPGPGGVGQGGEPLEHIGAPIHIILPSGLKDD